MQASVRLQRAMVRPAMRAVKRVVADADQRDAGPPPIVPVGRR